MSAPHHQQQQQPPSITDHERVDALMQEAAQMMQTDLADYAIPVLLADRTFDLVLSNAAFFFALLQQNSLEKSIHVLGILALLFSTYAVLNAVNEQLMQLIGSNQLRRAGICSALVRILYAVLAFWSGLFVRLISDPLVRGPHKGRFNFIELVWPLIAVVMLVSFFAQMKLATDHRGDTLQAIDNEKVALYAAVSAATAQTPDPH